MKIALKAIRLFGVLGGASILWMLVMAQFVNTYGGQPTSAANNLNYIATVTVPYGCLAVLLVLPYSRMYQELWIASFAFLCLAGVYVFLYLVNHLHLQQEWLMISEFTLLLLSQVIVIWIQRRTLPNKSLETNRS